MTSFTKKSKRPAYILESFDIFSIQHKKFEYFFKKHGDLRYVTVLKKYGYKKCIPVIKELILFIRVIVDWKMDLKDTRLLPFFENLIKLFDWIETDHNLLNCFTYFLNVLCSQVGQVTNMWLRFRESRSRFEEVE
jgi:hypothetical protein